MVVRVYGTSENVAVMALSPSMVTPTGLAVVVTSPIHRSSAQPAVGVAVTVSTVPYVAVAVTGSALPLPGGATFVVRVYKIWVNVAVTALSPSMVIVTGEPMPVTPPDHSSNCQPMAGVPVSVSTVPHVYVAAGGCTVMVPLPGGTTFRSSA